MQLLKLNLQPQLHSKINHLKLRVQPQLQTLKQLMLNYQNLLRRLMHLLQLNLQPQLQGDHKTTPDARSISHLPRQHLQVSNPPLSVLAVAATHAYKYQNRLL